MSNAFPEWQTEEIVEDVEDFLGGKKELPPAPVRHCGRTPPKKNTKNSMNPKAIVAIQCSECQAIEDDLITESLGAPSPLILEIDSVKPATKAANRGADHNHSIIAVHDVNTGSSSKRPQPPPKRPPGQLAANPRQLTVLISTTVAAASKSISSTTNCVSPSRNEVGAPPPLPYTSATAGAAAVAKPSPLPSTLGLRRSGNTKLSPSVGSLDEYSSSVATNTDSSSRKATQPYSALAMQPIPTMRRDVSAPAQDQGKGTHLSRNTLSVNTAADGSARHSGNTVAPVKPALLTPAGSGDGSAGARATAATAPATSAVAAVARPQPVFRSRTVPRTTTTTSTAIPVTTATVAGEAKLRTTVQPPPSRSAASSPDIASPMQQQQSTDTPTLPQIGVENTSKETEKGEYTEDELFPRECLLPVSEYEPCKVKRSTCCLNNSMMSSVGYSVLRGAYDSYATLDFGSTLPSLVNLSTTHGSAVAGSRAGSVRAANLMTVNNATALRAKGPFPRVSSATRRPQANGARPPHTGASQATTDDVTPGNVRSSKPDKKMDAGTPELGEDDYNAYNRHCKRAPKTKRAPQTKRELRRRNIDFEKM